MRRGIADQLRQLLLGIGSEQAQQFAELLRDLGVALMVAPRAGRFWDLPGARASRLNGPALMLASAAVPEPRAALQALPVAGEDDGAAHPLPRPQRLRPASAAARACARGERGRERFRSLFDTRQQHQ